jgi:hypothetical protein
MGEMPKNGLCPECHAPNVRNVEATDGLYDNPAPEQVSHFTKKVTMCWNQKRTDAGNYITHPLVEKMIPAVNISNQEIHDELHCGTCNEFYGRYNGRAATAEEIADCKAGKIAKPTGKSRLLGGPGP